MLQTGDVTDKIFQICEIQLFLTSDWSFHFQGNVALDVARVLLRPTTELVTTDIASHALAALKESAIRFLVLQLYNN